MTQEKIIVGAETVYPLKGALTLPDNCTAPVPAVVLVHGSGSSNMDEKVGRLTPFRDLAEGLARFGIASIRYDKRSFAHGLKLIRDKKITITVREETIEDALRATQMLREDPRIDPNRIFIIGHSMGAMLAPRIDAEGGNYAGLILMAGTPRRLEEVLEQQSRELLAESSPLIRRLIQKQINKTLRLFDGLYDLSDEEAKKKKLGGGTTLYYFKEMGEHPASRYLADRSKPLLILQGGKDVQVKPDTDFRMYRELLDNHPNATFKLYEDLNHCFVPGIYTSISKAKKDYSVRRPMDEAVIADIARWILA